MDIETLRAAVVKKHNVILGKDDPIFITVSLHEMLLAEALLNMKSIAVEARNESIAAVAHQVEVAKTAAGKLIPQTAAYAAGEVERQVKAGLVVAMAITERAVQAAERARTLAIWGAAVALSASSVAFGILVAAFTRP